MKLPVTNVGPHLDVGHLTQQLAEDRTQP